MQLQLYKGAVSATTIRDQRSLPSVFRLFPSATIICLSATNMQSADLQVIKDIPGYKVILKTVLKSQIQRLVSDQRYPRLQGDLGDCTQVTDTANCK